MAPDNSSPAREANMKATELRKGMVIQMDGRNVVVNTLTGEFMSRA